MAIRHFLLTHDDRVEEFTQEEAAQVASGDTSLPRFADKRLRYVQVAIEEIGDVGQIHVRTLGAVIGFDADGRLREANTPDDKEILSHFEHDACIQFALRETLPERYPVN